MVSLVKNFADAMPPPPQKSLKRDHSHLSSPTTPSTQDSGTSSQNKRLKVSFDDRVDVRIMDEWDSKPLELVREEVRSGIDGHLRTGEEKDDTGYEQLRTMFVNAGATQNDGVREAERERTSSSLLKKYMMAISGHMSQLRACAGLVHAVLDVNWIGRDDQFVAIYTKFLGSLGSALPGFLRTMLDRLVRHFVDLPASLGRLPGETRVSRQHMVGRIHMVLKYLVSLIPSASRALSDALRALFPNHRTTTRQAYIAFVKNSLRIVDYVPELKSEILTLITERLVKIDVEVQDELDDLEEEDEELILLGGKDALEGAELVDDGDESDAESVTSSELSVTPEEQRLRDLKETVGKLDGVLDLLFAHYTPTFVDGKRVDREDPFDRLMSQFQTFVLPTYRSRHTQFLVFHFAQLSQKNADRFAYTLVKEALNRRSASNGALSAAAYLASFIARGARISRTTIRAIFYLLAQHLNKLREDYEPVCRGPDLSRFGLFYATAQAMLYIFCFRWRDFILGPSATDADDTSAPAFDDYDILDQADLNWMPGIKDTLYQAIYSKLNPLKVCSPAIVQQFAAIANHLRFMYVFPILETNKRLRLSSYRGVAARSSYESAVGGAAEMGASRRENTLTNRNGEAHHQLDAFFPFDPYQLPKSKRWLEGDYMVWKGVPGMDNGDSDEESEGSEESEDEFEDEEGEAAAAEGDSVSS